MKEVIKIGFMGAGGTGKTTLASLLAGRLGIPFVPSVMRSVLTEFGMTELDMTDLPMQDVYRVQRAGFDRKVQQDITPHGVFDRTLADHFIYTMQKCAAIMDDQTVRTMEVVVRDSLKNYDARFYIPLNLDRKIEADGVRNHGLGNQLSFDMLMRGLLHRLEIDVIQVPDGKFADQVNWIADRLTALV